MKGNAKCSKIWLCRALRIVMLIILHRLSDIARYWLKIANFHLPHRYLASQLGATPIEFIKIVDFRKAETSTHQKMR